MFDVIAFDADDTLWHNEVLYTAAQNRLKEVLAKYHSPEWVGQQLYQTEMRNLELYGYGIKAFMLSMIETAIAVTEGRITGAEIQQIVDAGRHMLTAEIRPLPYVVETVQRLVQSYPLMILTKGDPLDQEAKLLRSGLGEYFRWFEVMSDKTTARYRAILERYKLDPGRFIMIGNSLRSDILPILELGATAVYVPYEKTWAHENNLPPGVNLEGYHEVEHMGLLPDLIDQLAAGASLLR